MSSKNPSGFCPNILYSVAKEGSEAGPEAQSCCPALPLLPATSPPPRVQGLRAA